MGYKILGGGGSSGGSIINFLSKTKVGVLLNSISTLLVNEKPAIKLNTIGTLLVNEKPAIRLLNLVSGTVKAQEKPAIKLTIAPSIFKVPEKPAVKLTNSPSILLVSEKPAFKIPQITLAGTASRYVNTAAADAGGTGTWNNPNNIVGAPQGTQAGSATFNGGLILGTGLLRGMAMVAQTGRPADLLITRIDLKWWGQTTGLPVVSDLISQLGLGFRINTSPLPGTDKNCITLTANDNFLGTPKTFRIDNGAGAFIDLTGTAVSWANIALLQPYFKATTIANGLMTYYADAIQVVVTVSLTWNP